MRSPCISLPVLKCGSGSDEVVLLVQVNLTEKDYQRKKNKWLAKIHAW